LAQGKEAEDRDGGTDEQANGHVEREVRPDIHTGESQQDRSNGGAPAEASVGEPDTRGDRACHHRMVAREREVLAAGHENEGVREHRVRA